MTRLVLYELFVTNLLLFEHQRKPGFSVVSWQFAGPYGVTKYGSGWRKDVAPVLGVWVWASPSWPLHSDRPKKVDWLTFLQCRFTVIDPTTVTVDWLTIYPAMPLHSDRQHKKVDRLTVLQCRFTVIDPTTVTVDWLTIYPAMPLHSDRQHKKVDRLTVLQCRFTVIDTTTVTVDWLTIYPAMPLHSDRQHKKVDRITVLQCRFTVIDPTTRSAASPLQRFALMDLTRQEACRQTWILSDHQHLSHSNLHDTRTAVSFGLGLN